MLFSGEGGLGDGEMKKSKARVSWFELTDLKSQSCG